MGAPTPNLKLKVPDFDQAPWDIDVNSNWLVIDATVGSFSTIPNMTGLWLNSHAYTYGQSAIDTDASVWSCIQSHTSSAAPQSFSVERTAFPGRWTMATAGAQFWASQAASSALDAANSASNAAISAAALPHALPLAGGTMTGYIVLHADPIANMNPATKQYVDAHVGGVGYLPTTGGVLTGALEVGGQGISFTNQGVAKHNMSFGWNGSSATIFVDGVGQGNLLTTGAAAAAYLPLTGGSISGSLISAGEIQAANTMRLNVSGAYWFSDANYTHFQMDSAGWRIRYNRATGTLQYIQGGGSILFTIDASGNTTILGQFSAASVVASGNSYTRGGNVYFGAADRSRLSSDNATVTSLNFLDNYRLQFNWADGGWYFMRYDNLVVFNFNYLGNASLIGTLTAAGLSSSGTVTAATAVTAVSGNMVFGSGGSGEIMQFGSSWYWDWNTSNGNLRWVTATVGELWFMRTSTNICGNNIGPVSGIGAYVNLSDIRSKTNIQPLSYGLSSIQAMKPILFTRISNNKTEIGFSAQDMLEIMPEAVRSLGEPDEEDPMLGLTIDPIVAALVNATKELARRIDRLEHR